MARFAWEASMKKQSVSTLDPVPDTAIAGRLRTILATTAAFWFGAVQAQAASPVAAREDAESRVIDSCQWNSAFARRAA